MIMGYMKIVLLSLATMSNILPQKEVKAIVPSQKSLTLAVKVNKGELAKRNKIKGFIKLVKPKYSESYIANRNSKIQAKLIEEKNTPTLLNGYSKMS